MEERLSDLAADWADCFSGNQSQPIDTAAAVINEYARLALTGDIEVPIASNYRGKPFAYVDLGIAKQQAAARYSPDDAITELAIVSQNIDAGTSDYHLSICSGNSLEYLQSIVMPNLQGQLLATAQLRLAVQVLLYHARPIAHSLIFPVIQTLTGRGRELLIVLAILLGLVPDGDDDAAKCLECVKSIESPHSAFRELVAKYWGSYFDQQSE